MSYFISIKTAILIFPLIAFLFTIPFILYSYHKYGAIHWFKVLITYSFILYLLVIYFLVILPLPTFEEAMQNTGPYFNFIPFHFVKDFMKETSFVLTDSSTYIKAITEPCFYVVIFNILMTVPFGMYLKYYFKCSLLKTVKYTFLLSLFFEITQGTGLYFIYPNPYRLCDIDDLILNTTGGFVGYFLMNKINEFLPSRDKIDEEAYQLGEKVSGLRRLTVFFFDLFLYGVFFLMSTILIDYQYNYLILFIIYYIGIPIINKNSTLGMKFLNIKMSYQKHQILKNILRSFFLVFYYFLLPIWLITGVDVFISIFNLDHIRAYLHLGILLFLFLFYMIQIIEILIHPKIYYDHFFGFQYVSTIKEKVTKKI